MGTTRRSDASIQAFFSPTPTASPVKSSLSALSSDAPIGDGFTPEEVKEALEPEPVEPWHPVLDYVDTEIRDLCAGPRPVTFIGRVANIFDVANTPKTPRAARGCVKLCVKDNTAAITVRVWYTALPDVRLGSLMSIWTNHISNGEVGSLSSTSAPLFASLFPERDRNCHMMVHENSDDGTLCIRPLGFRQGQPLNGLMTLQNFIDGGSDIPDAKVLVVVKSIGSKKTVIRRDESTTENLNLHIHDDTAEGTLSLWGTVANSPLARAAKDDPIAKEDSLPVRAGWKAGETVLLLQAPGWKIGRNTYLNLTSATMMDVDPKIPDADWLRRWSIRQKNKEAINPAFPETTYDLQALKHSPVRCLYTIGELDEFARAAPNEMFQGYLSVLITEVRLHENFRRRTLFSGECCNIPTYTNDLSIPCKGCDKPITLRLNPRIIGQIIDESAAIGSGKLLFSNQAWRELLGCEPEDMLKLRSEEVKYLSDRLLFCRVTMLFGWAGEENKSGGRICIMGVQA